MPIFLRSAKSARLSRAAVDFSSPYQLRLAVGNGYGEITGLDFAARPGTEAGETDLLRAWATVQQLKRTPFFSALSGPEVSAQYFSLPPLPPAELASAIHMEARQILGEAIEQMDSDFCFLEPGAGERRLLFAAAPRKHGDQRAGLLLGAGLRPGGVTLDGVALANACLGAPPAEAAPDRSLLVMHLGWRLANLALVRHGKLLFLRDITWGLDDLLEELAPRAALDPAAVSAMRLADKPLDAETAGHLEPSAASFLGELAKTHAYFQKATADLPCTQFALCGPGLLVPGLAELVGERLAMKRLAWQPLSTGDLAPGDDRRRAAVSCALLKGLLLDDG